ncbi:hypothetical protein [Halobacteriovorax marinus]|uniref:hypothetical protein n=1 Tax=Halobacteriovorax marinus TaxID=97084 RepID=UPI003A9051C8
MKEPNISIELRELMQKYEDQYPHGMICTGVHSPTTPHKTVHTTFGGFNSRDVLESSLANHQAIDNFLELIKVFSNKEIIQVMNKLILEDRAPKSLIQSETLDSLIMHDLLQVEEEEVLITGKGRIFMLSIFSIVS